MLVLFETPAGYALFEVSDETKLDKNLWKEFSSADTATQQAVKLKSVMKFNNISEAPLEVTCINESKPSKRLCKFLRAHCEGETLAVADSTLGKAIKKKLKIECDHNDAVMELIRRLRANLTELITGLGAQDLAALSLGLSHSLSRYKIKFSPLKVDIIVIQAIGLLDDLDKELNTYAMRVPEWYGWHFPELAKIVQDNILYAKVVKLMGDRTNAAKLDFSVILPEEVETELKEASVISMGTEVSDLDMMNIMDFCDQVLSLAECRAQLHDYLKSMMNTIAPNVSALVGELLGARLIAHGGSLLNLAKRPASSIQTLGAKKAYLLKSGLIYHASLIGQAPSKLKLKMSRSLAAKCALAFRYDAFGKNQDNSMGLENRLKLERRLRNLEASELGRLARSTKGKPRTESYKDHKKGAEALITLAKTSNPSADSGWMKVEAEKDEEMVQLGKPVADEKKDKKEKKEKNEMKDTAEAEDTAVTNDDVENEGIGKKEKKKKMKTKHTSKDATELQNKEENVEAGEKKKKKRKHADLDAEETETLSKKKEKKRKHAELDAEVAETPSKKKEEKKKKRKHAEFDAEETETPSKKKKKKRNHAELDAEETETPSKTKEKKTQTEE